MYNCQMIQKLHSSGPLSQITENVNSHKNMNTHILRGFIPNNTKIKATPISFRE